MDPTAASTGSSSLSDAPRAPATAAIVSAASSALQRGAADALSPSRGLKRARDADGVCDAISTTVDALPSDERPHKRQNDSPSLSDSSSSSSASASPSAVAGDSLRISNELLRSDNEQLQRELAALREAKAAADAQLSQQKQRVRNLEEDLTRIYRRQKREAESRQKDHEAAMAAMRQQLEQLAKQLEDRPAVDPTMALLTPETTREMDAYVATLAQWQAKLTTLSTQLADRVAQAENAHVRAVMDGMVERVSQAHGLSELREAEKQLDVQRAVVQQKEEDLRVMLEKMKSERDDVEAFEALERRVLEDRVAELNKTVENAKENERVLLQQMNDLREELVKMRSSNHVMPQREWQRKLQEDAQLKEQLEALTVRCEAQNVQLTLLREDLASLQTENDELAADLTARKTAAADDDDTASMITKQLEDRVAELKEQLGEAKKKAREAEAELRADHADKIREATENLNNRIEVLTMNVDAKAHVIEGLNADKSELIAKIAKRNDALERMHAEILRLKEQLEDKNQQLEKLRKDLSELQSHHEEELKQVKEEATSEKLELQKQMTSKTCEWVELNRELKELKKQIEAKTGEVRRLEREKSEAEARSSVSLEKDERLSSLESELETLREKNKEFLDKEQTQILESREKDERYSSLQTEVTMLREKNKELLGKEQTRASNDSRLREYLTSLERQKQDLHIENNELRMQIASSENDESQSDTHSSQTSGLSTLTPDLKARITKLLVEKQAVENFLRCYFDTAEAKCQSLSEQVAQLEAKQATHRQHARDSCHLLRLCTQVDSCDSTVRASILDVMTTLESIS